MITQVLGFRRGSVADMRVFETNPEVVGQTFYVDGFGGRFFSPDLRI